jgi:hypothetical protein
MADFQRRRHGAVFPVRLRVSRRLPDGRAADIPLRQSLWSELMCSDGILLGMGSCCCPETFFWRLSVAQPQQQGATVDRQGGRNGDRMWSGCESGGRGWSQRCKAGFNGRGSWWMRGCWRESESGGGRQSREKQGGNKLVKRPKVLADPPLEVERPARSDRPAQSQLLSYPDKASETCLPDLISQRFVSFCVYSPPVLSFLFFLI